MHASGSQTKRSPAAVVWFFGLLLTLFLSGRAWAQEAPVTELGETEETAETAERIRVLEAQRIRQDERASLWGGTGLVFTRSAVLLPRKHFNVSGYFNFTSYEYIQGWIPAYELQDPRRDDYEMNIVADYGLTHWVELSMFMNFFLQNERGDPSQLHMRQRGMGWTGLNGKFRFMDIEKDGLGIATTFYLRLPSPQTDALITSENLGYGVELNISLKLMVITEWLEKFTVHGNFGYGHFDYFDTGLAGLYQFVREGGVGQIQAFANRPDKYRNDYAFADLFDPTWGVDDVQMRYPWIARDHYTGSFAVEYRPALGWSAGFELIGYRMIEFVDDNLQIAPYVTYTFRQVPFIKRMHKDIITVSLAGQWGGLRPENRSSPQYGIVTGITYHTDLIF